MAGIVNDDFRFGVAGRQTGDQINLPIHLGRSGICQKNDISLLNAQCLYTVLFEYAGIFDGKRHILFCCQFLLMAMVVLVPNHNGEAVAVTLVCFRNIAVHIRAQLGVNNIGLRNLRFHLNGPAGHQRLI